MGEMSRLDCFPIPVVTFTFQKSRLIGAYPISLLICMMANFDFCRRPSSRQCLCSQCHMTKGLPVLPVLPHSYGILQMHCTVCCRSLSSPVFMSELLRAFLVLKVILCYISFLYIQTTLKHFTYGIYTEPRGFSSLFE
jgi:hypothetical protein